ncbi:hypothetical protein K1X84_08890 [bacterium]|nr:hypothetical protein [bacterium]
MQYIDLLHENLEIFVQVFKTNPDASLIEERTELNHRLAVYELNDEVFVFHFSDTALSQLIVFENVPAALQFLRTFSPE